MNEPYLNVAPDTPTSRSPVRPGRIGYIVIYLAFAAVLLRTLAVESIRPRLPTYLAAELVFIALFSLVFAIPRPPRWLLHLVFTLQSALILWLISLYPSFDFLILLFFLLSAQASLVFKGRVLWLWIAVFVTLSGGSLMYYLGAARGLSLSLTTIAAEFVIPAYLIVHRENEIARQRSQSLLGELQEANQLLQAYTSQAADLAALQERNRLARTLHDTTSQLVFSISLTVRSAQVLLETEPARLPEQLTHLETLTGEALTQLRSLITRLHPRQNPDKAG